jgi:energy-coupling factor transport system ATP-binding protein
MIEITQIRSRNLFIDHLEIPAGITTVIGKNGCGKTSFLRICAGIDLPNEGSIFIDGKLPREMECCWLNEFPDRNILFLRVFDEIASSLRFQYFGSDEIDSRVNKIAQFLEISHLLSRNTYELSGGEKMLVSFAAALVNSPEMLVLDEYDSHLDYKRNRQIEYAIMNSGNKYVLRCTQQMEIAANSDFLIVLDNGIIKHAGHPNQVFLQLIDSSYYPLSWRVRA